MAHTLRKVLLGNTSLVMVTITDYVTGGEVFTLAELGLTGSIVSMLFVNDASASIRPVRNANKVQLFNPVSDYANEVPSTIGLNYTFAAFIQGT